jgi:hypothetical protein
LPFPLVFDEREKATLGEREDRAERAIDYTRRVLQSMPTYRGAAIASLRRWRDLLAAESPDDPAIRKLDDCLARLDEGGAP